jgi:hypothetical protein
VRGNCPNLNYRLPQSYQPCQSNYLRISWHGTRRRLITEPALTVRITLDKTVLSGHLSKTNLKTKMGEFDWEGNVIRRIRHEIPVRFLAVLVMFTGVGSAAWCQEPPPQTPPPSLGDVARKAREEKAAREKNGTEAKKVFSNEGVIPTNGSNPFGTVPVGNSSQLSAGSAGRGGSTSGTTPAEGLASVENAEAKLDTALTVINSLAQLDRATMVNTILKGNNSDFPGRRLWEDRLMAGRDHYVSHGRQLIVEMKQLLEQAKQMALTEPNVSENDTRVQSLMKKVKDGYADAQKTADDFKRLVEEGLTLAKQGGGN